MPQKKLVILSVTNDLATDQRVQKVAQTLLDMGFEAGIIPHRVTVEFVR